MINGQIFKVVTYWLTYCHTYVKCNSINNKNNRVHQVIKKSFIENQVPINLKSFLEIFNDILKFKLMLKINIQ